MSPTTTTDENGLPPALAAQKAPAAASPAAVRGVAFAAMALIYCLAYFQRTGIPGTIFDELQHEFSLSASAVTPWAPSSSTLMPACNWWWEWPRTATADGGRCCSAAGS